MMWYRIKAFFKFYSRAITKYNVQSPFVFDFVNNVLDTQKHYYAFEKIENQRTRLKHVNSSTSINDFGAGSTILKSNQRKISDIASTSLSNAAKCRILFQIANHYQCNEILELGTSLGISSAYLASANHQSSVKTIEGDENIAKTAFEVHSLLGIKNAEIIVGQFSDKLSDVLSNLQHIDLAFIDGHHEKSATLHYFELILQKCSEKSILVFDDIYWSEGMTQAWNQIIHHERVKLSIDLFDIGIVFMKKELTSQQLTYIPFKYKPWKIGLFG